MVVVLVDLAVARGERGGEGRRGGGGGGGGEGVGGGRALRQELVEVAAGHTLLGAGGF